MPDYETLRLIWWLLLLILLVAFAVTDGYDLGVAALFRVLARDEQEREALLGTIEPVWEGNQVWLVLGAGASFAAFPLLYAAAFSGFYAAMLLVLLALILRPVGFNFRAKLEHPRWRAAWDAGIVLSGVVPALVFGVAVGNLFLGVPFTFDPELRLDHRGGFLDLLQPLALMFGAVSLAMHAMHGCAWLAVKGDEALAGRARRLGRHAALAFVALLAIVGAWTVLGLPAFELVVRRATDAPSNPLMKQAAHAGSWLANYRDWPALWLVPLAAYGGALATWLALGRARDRLALLASSASVAGTVATAGVALFPFLLPSSFDPNASLTIWDSSSSQGTLFIMLLAAGFFLPLIALYTAWVVRKLRGRVPIGAQAGGH